MSKRKADEITPVAPTRPRRARKAPARFEFDAQHGYEASFIEEMSSKYSKDLDENWESILESDEAVDEVLPQPETPDDSWDPEAANAPDEDDDDDEEFSECSDSDSYDGTRDSDLSDGEIVDLNNLPEDDEDSDEQSEDYSEESEF